MGQTPPTPSNASRLASGILWLTFHSPAFVRCARCTAPGYRCAGITHPFATAPITCCRSSPRFPHRPLTAVRRPRRCPPASVSPVALGPPAHIPPVKCLICLFNYSSSPTLSYPFLYPVVNTILLLFFRSPCSSLNAIYPFRFPTPSLRGTQSLPAVRSHFPPYGAPQTPFRIFP
ncbi:hypothetical protein B0H17DRAFT_1070792 [Mycena rosella]|uniref:Uncharacterized protein n=1 Tax=Mycena rosella TaxID=1033263 RepID=A0AAD7DC64_MYCRO|nr:hypothetical protein B0H17DRAFT_1070792 [Mycena rosella]